MGIREESAEGKAPKLMVIPRTAVVREAGSYFVTSEFAAFLRVLAEKWGRNQLIVTARRVVTTEYLEEITDYVDEVLFLPWRKHPMLISKIMDFVNTFVLLKRYARQSDAFYIILPSYWGIIAAIWVVMARKTVVLEISGDIRKALPATSKLRLGKSLMKVWAELWDVMLVWCAKRATAVVVSAGKLAKRYSTKTLLVFRPFFVVPKDDLYLREDSCLSSQIKLLYVGALAYHKGVEVLIRAMSLLPKNEYELILVGRDVTEGKIAQEVKRLGLTRVVQFKGYVPHNPDFWQLYREADIFVLPSFTEGTPRVLYEAMSQSLPIITTPVGAIPKFLEDGKTAIFVDPGIPEEIADAVLLIANNAELRQRLIKESYKKLQKLMSDDWLQSVVSILKGGDK